MNSIISRSIRPLFLKVLPVVLGFGVLAIPSAEAQSLPPLPTPIDLNAAPATQYSKIHNYPFVTWDALAHFDYDAPDMDEEIDPTLRLKKKRYPIPDFIKKLNGVSIAAVGFMIPLETNPDMRRASTFILARSQASCCYGLIPKMNEWIYVQMNPGKTADASMDVPVTVFGVLSVGEKRLTNDGWSLYRMTSDKVSVYKPYLFFSGADDAEQKSKAT